MAHAISYVGNAASSPNFMTMSAPYVTGLLGFLGVALGIWATRLSQIAADRRTRLQRETSARSVVYAQLRRIHSTTRQQLDFVAGPDRMIWLTLHRSLYPSVENLARLESLTALETDAVTAFYYLYQEQVSFLTASAMEVWPDDVRSLMTARFNLESDVIGFDYSVQGRKDALVLRLSSIHKKADKALALIRVAIRERASNFPDLAKLVERETTKIATYNKPSVPNHLM